MARAWSLLARSHGAIPVPRLAEEVGWGVRQLENRFREQIGLGPKAAARVLRLQRARRLLAAGRGPAETAALCGYYDQAHLSGEFKAMTGCTPREFDRARRLLNEQRLPVVEVAFHVGFTDPHHFSRVFKQMMGVAPSYYNKHRSGLDG